MGRARNLDPMVRWVGLHLPEAAALAAAEAAAVAVAAAVATFCSDLRQLPTHDGGILLALLPWPVHRGQTNAGHCRRRQLASLFASTRWRETIIGFSEAASLVRLENGFNGCVLQNESV
jgi:hypothetical protein